MCPWLCQVLYKVLAPEELQLPPGRSSCTTSSADGWSPTCRWKCPPWRWIQRHPWWVGGAAVDPVDVEGRKEVPRQTFCSFPSVGQTGSPGSGGWRFLESPGPGGWRWRPGLDAVLRPVVSAGGAGGLVLVFVFWGQIWWWIALPLRGPVSIIVIETFWWWRPSEWAGRWRTSNRIIKSLMKCHVKHSWWNQRPGTTLRLWQNK